MVLIKQRQVARNRWLKWTSNWKRPRSQTISRIYKKCGKKLLVRRTRINLSSNCRRPRSCLNKRRRKSKRKTWIKVNCRERIGSIKRLSRSYFKRTIISYLILRIRIRIKGNRKSKICPGSVKSLLKTNILMILRILRNTIATRKN